MNLIPGTLGRDGDRTVFRGGRISLTLPERFAGLEPAEVTVGIRPEHLGVGGSGELAEKIHLVEPLGKDTLLYFDYGGEQDLIAVVNGVSTHRTNTEVTVGFTPDHLFLFDADGQRIR